MRRALVSGKTRSGERFAAFRAALAEADRKVLLAQRQRDRAAAALLAAMRAV